MVAAIAFFWSFTRNPAMFTTLLFCHVILLARECPGGGCVDVFPPRHSVRPFHHIRSSTARLLPPHPPITLRQLLLPHHQQSERLPSPLPPFPRPSFSPPLERPPSSLPPFPRPSFSPPLLRPSLRSPAQHSALCCPRVSAAARGNTDDEPKRRSLRKCQCSRAPVGGMRPLEKIKLGARRPKDDFDDLLSKCS
jgi:hypothetical protein